jgi:recombination protein RecA
MSDQVRRRPKPQAAIKADATFLPSGSVLLDLVLGGGYGIGRIANIVGDRSSGKTLLAIEACANFAMRFGPDRIRYAEAEAAFDMEYAAALGMPPSVRPSEPGEIPTVEALYRDLAEFLERQDGQTPCLYVLDSLDALSDEAEVARGFGDATYGTGKAKAMSELFRRLTADIRDKKCLFLVISQIRDNIGVTFGETKKRAGGRALDFYASQVIWLAEIKKIQREISGVKRTVGIQVQAKNKKNKMGKPFRDAKFTLMFGYGIDDEISMLDWLGEYKAEQYLKDVGSAFMEMRRSITKARAGRDREALREFHATLRRATEQHWNMVEEALEPPMGKY